MSWWDYKPYVSAAQRRANAARRVAAMAKKGRQLSPVEITGRTIASTFWGKAWCDNLESYSDYENRLPRGRTYVRNGSVIDLQIEPGQLTAMVSGSEIYKIKITIKPLSNKRWNAIKARCAGQIASLIELLQGRLSKGVMEIITHPEHGMFPAPAEISLDCSCPDWADMCKHVAAVLYGVGARLDQQPELLFKLRQVDHMELIEQAGNSQAIAPAGDEPPRKTIATNDLADVFGIELDTPESGQASPPDRASAPTSQAAADKPARSKRPTRAKRPAGSKERVESTKPAPKAKSTRTNRSRKAPTQAGNKTVAKRRSPVARTASKRNRTPEN